MQERGAFQEILTPAICVQKSLALASVQGNLGISAVARQRRRLLGPRGGAPPQNALAATDVDATSNGGDGFAP